MALTVPGRPNVPFPTSIVTPMGPAPRGQAAAVQFPLAMANTDNLADPEGGNNVIAGNFNPKPHRGRYADCFYHHGMPVWINTNHSVDNGILKQYSDSSVNFGARHDSLFTLPCLNLMLREAAGSAREDIQKLAAGAAPISDEFDLRLVNHLSEAGITPLVDQVAGKGLKNATANHILNITVQGFLRTHNFLGLVEVPNSDAPPTVRIHSLFINVISRFFSSMYVLFSSADGPDASQPRSRLVCATLARRSSCGFFWPTTRPLNFSTNATRPRYMRHSPSEHVPPYTVTSARRSAGQFSWAMRNSSRAV